MILTINMQKMNLIFGGFEVLQLSYDWCVDCGDQLIMTCFKLPNREPQWTDDELLCARSVNNEVHFYENRDFSECVQCTISPWFFSYNSVFELKLQK